MKNRRDFITDTAAFSAVMAFAGCASAKWKATVGAPMSGFVAPETDVLRVGIIGLNRGAAGLKLLSTMPGSRVTAICDLNPELIGRRQKEITDCGRPPAKVYTGSPEAWKKMADDPEVDFVVVGTPWALHTPMAVYLMEHGKNVGVEVPAAMTVDECWQLVETSERTRRVCMQLENRCYNETEMMMFNAIRKGELGEVVYAESGYIHEIRNVLMPKQFPDGTYEPWPKAPRIPSKGAIVDGLGWRGRVDKVHCGNLYPTHGVGPISQILGINRGDNYDYIVAAETGSFALREYAEEMYGVGSKEAKAAELKMGDHHVGLIRTKRGKLISLSHNVVTPRTGARLSLVEGTKGAFLRHEGMTSMEILQPGDVWQVDDGFRHSLLKTPVVGTHRWCSPDCGAEYAKTFKHPLWRDLGEFARVFGGHGGQDTMMYARIVYCFNKGLPLDQDVYDLAAWSSIVELSEKSVLAKGRSQDFPDFTRGAWKTRAPLEIGTIDADYVAAMTTALAKVNRRGSSL